jgi:MYXO-CTERM domain-containing protein
VPSIVVPEPMSDDDAGCGCRIEKAPPRHEGALWIGALAVLAGSVLRRRRTGGVSTSDS